MESRRDTRMALVHPPTWWLALTLTRRRPHRHSTQLGTLTATQNVFSRFDAVREAIHIGGIRSNFLSIFDRHGP